MSRTRNKSWFRLSLILLVYIPGDSMNMQVLSIPCRSSFPSHTKAVGVFIMSDVVGAEYDRFILPYTDGVYMIKVSNPLVFGSSRVQ